MTATTPPQVAASFRVDVERLREMGVADPYSPSSIEHYKSGKLTSDERLFFTLWGSQYLPASTFSERKRLATKGGAVASAYFVVSGDLLGIDGDLIYRLGPGSVIGLAEGLARLPYSMTVVSVSALQVRIFPMHKIDEMLERMPTGFRSILRTTVDRTLGIDRKAGAAQ